MAGDFKYAKQMLEWNRLLASHVETLRLLILKLPHMIPEIIQNARALKSYEPESDMSEKLASVIEDIQQLVATFAPKVTLELLSPRVLRMVVHWRVPAWKCEEAVWQSGSSHGKFWTNDEKTRFIQIASKVSSLELIQAFPNRSWQGLYGQAQRAGMIG